MIAMAQEEHVGLVEEVEREAGLEGMAGDVVRVKAVNRQMMVDAQHAVNHLEKTVNAIEESRKEESDSLTIEELDNASSEEEEEEEGKGSSNSGRKDPAQSDRFAALREDKLSEEGRQCESDAGGPLLNNASSSAPKVLMVAPTANGPTPGAEDEVHVGWSPEVLQASDDKMMGSSAEEVSRSPGMPSARLSPAVAGSPSSPAPSSPPQRETFPSSRPNSNTLKSARSGSTRRVEHLEVVSTAPRSRPGSHTRVTVTRPGSATTTHQDQLGHLDNVAQVNEALEPHVVVQQPAELVLVAEALRTPKAPVKVLQGGIPLKAKARRKSLLDIALADLEKMERDESKIEEEVTDNPAVTIVRADSICRSQTLPKRKRKVYDEPKEWDVESATGEGPICISNLALVVYIFLGCVIGILTVLNLLFGFHLILTFLLVLFVFILLILLTDNIGLDR